MARGQKQSLKVLIHVFANPSERKSFEPNQSYRSRLYYESKVLHNTEVSRF